MYTDCVYHVWYTDQERGDKWGVVDGKRKETPGFSLWEVQEACSQLFSGSAQQWKYLKASCLQKPPLAAQKERLNEQGQTLLTNEEMLYLLFTHLQGPCAIQN